MPSWSCCSRTRGGSTPASAAIWPSESTLDRESERVLAVRNAGRRGGREQARERRGIPGVPEGDRPARRVGFGRLRQHGADQGARLLARLAVAVARRL